MSKRSAPLSTRGAGTKSSRAAASPQVIVVGSLNVDRITRVATIPVPGETIIGHSLVNRFGGKGANQAYAASRQGERVGMIGCVGQDAEGDAYAERFRRAGIQFASQRSATLPTGAAFIAVDDRGENTIVCVPGANGALTAAHVRRNTELIKSASVLLLQWEIPEAAVLEAVRQANRFGVKVVINPSPFRDGFPWGRVAVDTVIVNRGEARQMFGSRSLATAALARRMAQWRIERLVVTQGGEPTRIIADGAHADVPVLRIEPIDTVGAGDTFAGAYAARIAGGEGFTDAVRHANVAAALSTLKVGAQEGAPSLRETLRALRTMG